MAKYKVQLQGKSKNFEGFRKKALATGKRKDDQRRKCQARDFFAEEGGEV